MVRVNALSTCDDVELQDVADFGAEEKRLATDAGVRERAADAEVEVVRPRPRGESEL